MDYVYLAVQVQSVLRLSPSSWQVQWRETLIAPAGRDLVRGLLGQARAVGELLEFGCESSEVVHVIQPLAAAAALMRRDLALIVEARRENPGNSRACLLCVVGIVAGGFTCQQHVPGMMIVVIPLGAELSAGRIYLRGRKYLWCVGKKE